MSVRTLRSRASLGPSLAMTMGLAMVSAAAVDCKRKGDEERVDTRTQPASVGGPQAASSAAPGATATPAAAAGRHANIVFVLADDFAWNLVKYMPHVLEMQKNGTTFSNYFVTDSLCCPSRTSIFTGRFPHDSGVFTNGGKDGGYAAFVAHGDERATFATALTSAGYKTAMLGKYLNGYQPPTGGVPAGWSFWAVAGHGYPEFRYALNENGKVVRYGEKPSDYLTDVVGGLGAGFIKQQSAAAPFFIEVATFAPHGPYTPAPRDADAFPGVTAPRTPAFNAAPDPDAPKWVRELPPLSPDDMTKIDQDFRKRAQSVLAIDAMITGLMEATKAIGEEKNTYFFFSSDNGLHMGEHRLMPGKQTPYETDIHVPLIVVGPGVPAGRVVDEFVENVDLCPTFAEIGEATAPPGVDGKSLVPLLRAGAPPEWRTVVLIEHHGPHADPTDPDAPVRRGGNPTTYEAIRTKSSVYVEYADGEREYHDLGTDPNELKNTFAAVPQLEKAGLHETLAAIKDCHDAASCWAAQRPARTGK